MADNRYGGYRREGWQGRDESIFSDDDERRSRGTGRWSSEHGREPAGRSEDERGFFERAGDEVRSWFGDEEAERRRELDSRRDPGFVGGDTGRFERGASRTPYGGYGASGSRDRDRFGDDFRRREQGARFGGQRSFGTGSGLGGGSSWDDNYRQWRDRQIAQFDREYEDYCREHQQQFEQDFDRWRGSRLTEGGESGQYGDIGAAATRQAAGGGGSRSQSSAAGTSGALGAETSGATATGEAGSASAPGSGGSGGGRGGRARS